MNKELKDKWLVALRDGSYKQGRYALRNIDNEFCCLGVLCDLINRDMWSLPVGEAYNYPSIDLDYSIQLRLAAMNDGLYGYEQGSFLEIADYIEKNVECTS